MQAGIYKGARGRCAASEGPKEGPGPPFGFSRWRYWNSERTDCGDWLAIDRDRRPSCGLIWRACKLADSFARSASTRLTKPASMGSDSMVWNVSWASSRRATEIGRAAWRERVCEN